MTNHIIFQYPYSRVRYKFHKFSYFDLFIYSIMIFKVLNPLFILLFTQQDFKPYWESLKFKFF